MTRVVGGVAGGRCTVCVVWTQKEMNDEKDGSRGKASGGEPTYERGYGVGRVRSTVRVETAKEQTSAQMTGGVRVAPFVGESPVPAQAKAGPRAWVLQRPRVLYGLLGRRPSTERPPANLWGRGRCLPL